MSVDLQPGESRGYWRQLDPDLWFKPTDHEVTPEIQRPSKIAEYRQSTAMDLLPGESRGYWKHHSPGKWFRQAKITCKIHNEKAILLLDTGAEVSIVDTAFATRIKVTLAGSLVYFFDIWVGDLTGQRAKLGMDFMVPAGIRLDLAHESISLSEEVRIQLSGRRKLYSDKAKIVNVGQYLRIQAGESGELPLCLTSSIHDKLWVTRRDQWVPTISGGSGKTKYISITNIGDEVLTLHHDQRIGSGWLETMCRGYRVLSRSDLNLALEATADTRSEEMEVQIPLAPAVERPEYETPRAILQRPKATLIQCRKVEASQDQDIPDCLPSDDQDQLHLRGQDQGTSPSKCGGSDLPSMIRVQSGTGHVTGDPSNDKCMS
ncbi:hypothetical protein PHMEG_00025874 [Phytophthora megakarya]|uniref:Eukaryotic/viral aspartic protease n=1 Tax=Phytophthora megakarya TaxID=4795 RepID=A0A225VAZ8_9STRA|nr:hypothetical protein PHMEG_00025874 [Phytophthora megakarya]